MQLTGPLSIKLLTVLVVLQTGQFGKVFQAVLNLPDQNFTRTVAVKTVKGKIVVCINISHFKDAWIH